MIYTRKYSTTRRTCLALSVSLALVSSAVNADFLNDIYTGAGSNVTNGASFQSGGMTYYTAGSVSARFPVSSLKVISFTPPSFKGGCNGVDMMAGSFGFMNRAQLEQFMRSVVQNAGAVAFTLAMEVLSAPLKSVMKEWVDKISSLNEYFRNSCAAAKGLVAATGATAWAKKTSADLTSSTAEGMGGSNSLGSDSNAAAEGDASTAQEQMNSDPNTEQNSADVSDGSGGTKKLPVAAQYNLMWLALNNVTDFNLPDSSPLKNVVNGDTDLYRRLVMSMFGTQVIGSRTKSQDSNSGGDTTSPARPMVMIQTETVFPDDFVGEPSIDVARSINLIQCSDAAECLPSGATAQKFDITSQAIGTGFASLAKTDLMTIIEAINSGDTASQAKGWDAVRQVSAWTELPVPKLISVLHSLSTQAGSASGVLDLYARLVGEEAVSLIYEQGAHDAKTAIMRNSDLLAQSGVEPNILDQMIRNIDLKRDEVRKRRQLASDRIAQMNVTVDFLNQMQKAKLIGMSEKMRSLVSYWAKK